MTPIAISISVCVELRHHHHIFSYICCWHEHTTDGWRKTKMQTFDDIVSGRQIRHTTIPTRTQFETDRISASLLNPSVAPTCVLNSDSMILHQTSETTSLLNYASRSNNRHVQMRNLAIVFVVILVLGIAFLVIRNPHHVAQAYVMMGLSRSVPINLNSRPSSAPEGCESTIMLIRHCDKEGPQTTDDERNRHCSYEGFQRAYHLASLFGTRWPIPAKLYALTGGRKGHKNYREIEMLDPLASKIGVEINSKFSTMHTQRAAEEIYDELRSGNLCGKLTVFSWKHSHMPELAHALGWKDAPSHYPMHSFDQVWQIKYVFSPPAVYKEYRLHGKEKETRNLVRSTRSPKTPKWVVFGSIGYQYFDPLTFSYESGDYPRGGKKTGESWAYDL